ncbi:hypothetical protein AS030_08170 [Fictibacillus enclensis]|uniref:LUD domain-containing protein n=1 Tax=Fictibacillus enclensis TaxID=1017270 RepID=A0A0V8JEL0_9BACL|nr:hypothetical protein AS030_08170 [Fictibacillus enclensis]
MVQNLHLQPYKGSIKKGPGPLKASSYEWNAGMGNENILLAERSNAGITFSEMTLAEAGTVVLYSSMGIGRSVSLLPTTYTAYIMIEDK